MTRTSRRRALQACLAHLLLGAAASAPAQPAPPAASGAPAAAGIPDLPAELKTSLPQARLIGRGRLKFWGFEVYDARLWAPAGFAPARYGAFTLALELAYLRDFKALDIAERSLKEMRRSQLIGDDQAAQWGAEMLRVLPDVRRGDRLTGLHRPDEGAAFWVNGQASGEIRNAEFSRLFFGIWLSPKTSELPLRAALLGESRE